MATQSASDAEEEIRVAQSEQPPVEQQYEAQMEYPSELLEDADAAQDFLCIMCNKLPRAPLELACGHGACCGQCRGSIQCPSERSCRGRSEVERMGAANRRNVLNLKIKCLRSELGCEWVGLVKHWDEHVMNECEYALVDCLDCAVDGQVQVQVRKCELEQHQAECRRFECALKKNEINCVSGGRMNEMEFKEHREHAFCDHIDAIAESLSRTKLNVQDRMNMLQEQNRGLQEEVDKLKHEAEAREEVVKNLSNEMNELLVVLNDMNRRLACCEYVQGIIDRLPVEMDASSTPTADGTDEQEE